MTDERRVRDFLDSLDPGGTPFLEELRAEAVRQEVPVMRRGTEALLKTVIAMIKPAEILEVGTGSGYSAAVMAEAAPEAKLTTIESWPPRIRAAKENLNRAGLTGRVTLLEGDAGMILPHLPEERYELIFMDAAKGQYLAWLPHLLKCLKTGGVLVSDNVLQDGTAAESRFSLDRRDRTIHARMRDYLYALTHTEGLVTSVTENGDGTALSVKTGPRPADANGQIPKEQANTEAAGKYGSCR